MYISRSRNDANDVNICQIVDGAVYSYAGRCVWYRAETSCWCTTGRSSRPDLASARGGTTSRCWRRAAVSHCTTHLHSTPALTVHCCRINRPYECRLIRPQSVHKTELNTNLVLSVRSCRTDCGRISLHTVPMCKVDVLSTALWLPGGTAKIPGQMFNISFFFKWLHASAA